MRGLSTRARAGGRAVSWLAFLALGAAITACTAVVDFAHARYVRAVGAREAHVAARWSVAQGLAGAVGFVLCVQVDMRLLVFEALGLYLGTWAGCRLRR